MSQQGPFQSPLPRVGEADTIRAIDGPWGRHTVTCSARKDACHCTRKLGHPGDHLAGDGRRIVARWPQETAPLEPQDVAPGIQRGVSEEIMQFVDMLNKEQGRLMLGRPPAAEPDAHRLERRRFYLAADLYVRGPESAEQAVRYADDLILEHLATLDKFLDRVRESAKENANA